MEITQKRPQAAIIIIGNEILSGRTRDENLNFLACNLVEAGVNLAEVRIIADIESAIIDAVNELRGKFDYVFTTGGIGPTHDDITALSIAKAFGVDIIEDTEAIAAMNKFYEGRDDILTEVNRRMANIPEGASLIDNPISGAPGFHIENTYVFAGVPVIMRAMFDSMKHELQGSNPIISETIVTNISEGKIAKELGQVQSEYPQIDIGSYPYFEEGRFGVNIVIRSDDIEYINIVKSKIEKAVSSLGGTILK